MQNLPERLSCIGYVEERHESGAAVTNFLSYKFLMRPHKPITSKFYKILKNISWRRTRFSLSLQETDRMRKTSTCDKHIDLDVGPG